MPPSSHQSEDLFRLMRRLIDDVDQEHRVAHARGNLGYANFADSDQYSSAWSHSTSYRHPTLGEIIQSMSKQKKTRSIKSSSSAAPSVVSGAGSNYTASTALSKTSHTKSSTNYYDVPKRKHHAAINREKRQREIASENLRMYQRLQMVRASPTLSRDRQIADWQRQAGLSTTMPSSSTSKHSNYPNRSSSSYGIAPLSGLIGSAGQGAKPMRPQSAVAYMNAPPSRASSITSDKPPRSGKTKKSSKNRPSSGFPGGDSSANVYLEGSGVLTGEYMVGQQQRKKKSRPISGHL